MCSKKLSDQIHDAKQARASKKCEAATAKYSDHSCISYVPLQDFMVKLGCCLLLLVIAITPASAQPALVLPTDGKSVQEIAPQGGLRFQRHLYLITAEEMQQSEFRGGLGIDGIGFTIAAAQSDTTRGNLKVFLQNTSDQLSRRDTNWTFLPSSTNTLTLEGLAPGQYEWQVQTVCGTDSSAFSPSLGFATADPEDCNTAANLQSSQITSSSALLRWSAPFSNDFSEYLVEHSIAGSNVWITNRTTETELNIVDLRPDTIYQWRVQTLCSAASASLINASFSTLGEAVCDQPRALQSVATGNDQAQLSWAAASDATRYDIEFRPVGTEAWLFTISLTDSLNLTNLQAGTTYEWRVRSVCTAGNGSFENGPNFTTSGSAFCLPPSSRSTAVLSDTRAVLSWATSAGATSYVLRYRLKNAISWTNVIQPMELVHHAEVLLPDSIGPFHIPFQGDGISPFTYDGQGLYVAWEYTNQSNPTAAPNSMLATTANTRIIGSFGQDSLQRVLSLVAPNELDATAHADLLFATNLRPATFLSSNALNDVVSVEVIHALGTVAPPFSSPSPITAVVKNHSDQVVNAPVSLSIRAEGDGSIRFSNTQNASLAPRSTSIIAFDIWEPTVLGKDSLWVSIQPQPNESIVGNNQSVLVQEVTQTRIGFADESLAVTNTGFGEVAGLILARLPMNGCGRVNAAEIFLDASAADQPLYALVLDANGNRVDSSAVFRPDSTEVDNVHTFFFPKQPFFDNSFYYLGLAQSANPGKVTFPVGVQWETEYIQDSAYFRANLDGSDLRQVSLPGRLMITAEVLPPSSTPYIVGPTTICPGNSATLSVGENSERFANEVLQVSSSFSNTAFNASQILGSPSLFPAYGPQSGQWIPQTADGQREFIELRFPAAGAINYVKVFETFNPGAIDSIYARNPGTGLFELIYAGRAEASALPAQAKVLEFPLTNFAVSEIRLAMASNTVSGFNGIDAVAIGHRQEISAFASYAWSSGETSASIIVQGPGQYAVSISDEAGCSSTASIQMEDPNQERPGIAILNDAATNFCAGESITLIASEADAIIWNTDDSTATLTVTESGTYFYTQNVAGGCGLVTSDSISITVHPLPAIGLPPVSSICLGETLTVDAGAGFTTYEWSTGSTEQTISVATPDTYSVTVSNNNGCEGSASTVAIFTPVPDPQIEGNLVFCPGSSTRLQLTRPFSEYTWSTGSTTASIEVSRGGTYSVTVVDENGCSAFVAAEVVALPAPNPIISGNLSFCAGNTTTLDVGLGFNTYLWSTGETSPSIIVDTVSTFSVTVTDANGCTGSSSASTTENGALPVSPGPISGPSIGLCQTTDNVYSIDPLPNTTHYVWTVPEGDTIVSGQGTTSITVNHRNLNSGYIVVAASNACGQSPSITPTELFVRGTPSAPGPITGPSSGLCYATNQVYSIEPVEAATAYQWEVPSGATLVDGQGSTSITVNFGSLSAGEISVYSINNCGSSGLEEVSILSVKGAPQAISGRDIVVNQNTYTIAPIPGTTDYLWEVPEGISIDEGQGTNSIKVSLSTSFLAGQVCVMASNNCGSGEAICTAVPLSVELSTCAAAYIGYEPARCVSLTPLVRGGMAPYTFSWSSGETGSSITVCPAVTTIYQLQVTDANGLSTTVNSEVEVYDIRCGVYNTFVEVCRVSGLSSSSRSLCVTQSRVDYYLENGGSLGDCELLNCTGSTQALSRSQATTQFTDRDGDSQDLILFPNPTQQSLHLSFGSELEEQVSVKILDINGQVWQQRSWAVYQGKNTLDIGVAELPAGIYLLQITGKYLLLQQKFSKI